MTEPEWDKLGGFEKHPKLTEKYCQKIGDKVDVVFLDNGSTVDAEKVAAALKKAKKKGIQAKDSIVFVVETNAEKFDFWVGATNYSILNQLKTIRNENNNTLIGAKVRIEKVSENDTEKSSLSVKKI